MKYLKINGKDYFEYELKDFDLNKWYIFTDNGAEGCYRSNPFKTKKEACYNFVESKVHRSKYSSGVYEARGRSYIMTGKTAIKHGFNEWCYEVDN